MAEEKSGRRSCGECSVCCEGWLSADIRGHKMGGGQPCHFLEAGGCSIYGYRPDLCRSFECGWLMSGSRFPEEWRPDKVRFLIQPGEWDGGKCWLLHHAGQDPSDEVLQMMREHTKATGEPHIVVKQNSWLCYGKPEFQKAMVNFKKGENPAAEFKVNFLSKED